MKKIIPAVLALALSSFAFGASDSAPAINLLTKDSNQELAAGFAAAFATIRNVPIHLMIDREGKTTIFADVRKITAAGAVLVVENGKGQIYVISPRDVVWLSDSPAEKLSNATR